MLHIHRAERADHLAEGLADTLRDPLEDPFAPDVVAVPTRGVERWLAQQLSTRLGATADRFDGVCANVAFPFPGRLVQAALAAATGIDPEHDPWRPAHLAWPLLEVVDRCLGEPWLATLAHHLQGARGDPADPLRRFAVVRHVADLFDRYGVRRPELLRGWLAVAEEHAGDWQAELWRRLRAHVGSPSPAERLPDACARIRTHPRLLDLPPRLSLFGLTRLPRSYLEVLAAIAARRDVHLFVLHPSPALWREVEHVLRADGPAVSRRADPTAALPANRLLASWGRDARELQLVLAAAAERVELHHAPAAGEPRTLLERLQADVRADRPPPGAPLPGAPDLRPALAPDDRSLRVHACHGRARQVEVLRDAVLHLLADDPTLEPRDVIVMCPDIETFAPLIEATFGSVEHDGLPDLRVRLADRSLRETNPVLTVTGQLLELPGRRATASQLLDLAAREPVRRRFGFDGEDLARLQEWVVASGVRWGFDAEHREPFGLGSLKPNTWRAGLDRILAGVAMTEEDRRLIGGVLPLDDVESGAIELAGRLAEYVERVREAVAALSGAKPIGQWARAIADAAEALTATGERDAWQRRELERVLEDVVADAEQAPASELQLADVRGLLADRLKGRPTRANFRTGHLTVCTLVPMRSVPHRVICILGLDDGEFPRRTRRDGDDRLLHDPQVGDRDPRAEDRQMLLDALLAATERLIITYTGNDERTGLRRPPAVPVGELLDVVERTVRRDAGSAVERIVVAHPLQPFDPRNFTPGTLVADGPWGFDRRALAGAHALSGPREPRHAFLPAPLPPRDDDLIELDRLVRFAERPIRALLRDRLGILLGGSVDEVQDAIPVELDNLAAWGVGQRLLEGMLAGADMNACLLAEQKRGWLPPARLAIPVLERVRDAVRQIVARAQAFAGEAPISLDVNLALSEERTLAGTVTGVCGHTLRAVSYARVKPRDRLRAWVRLLALSASRPELPFESVVIGRARAHADDAQVTLARIPPLAEDAAGRRARAHEHLTVLLDLYDRGMREPLPLTCDASAAYAEAAAAGRDAMAAARAAWTSEYEREREDREPEHRLVFGGAIDFAALTAEGPRADEHGDGWEQAEATRFGRYARRLWDGLLAVEVLSDR